MISRRSSDCGILAVRKTDTRVFTKTFRHTKEKDRKI
jgi:hypothetical protein